MDSATGRADYAEARHVRSRSESISTRNGGVDEPQASESQGVGVRVRVGGALGFAATREQDRAGLEHALEQALAIAAAQPSAPATPLTGEQPARGRWESACELDPFHVPLEEKIETLVAADRSMQGESAIELTSAHYVAFSD